MGRPTLGAAARTVLLATKGTKAERDALIAKYGSVYAGMRFALRLALEDDVRIEATGVAGTAILPEGYKPPVVEVPASAVMPHVESVEYATARPRQSGNATEQATVAEHRHRRGKRFETSYEAGVERKRYRCAFEGCEELLG